MIDTTRDGDILDVTFNRPESRNALTRDGLADLRETFETATAPVVYLSGAGTAFSAGADFDIVSSLSADEAEPFIREGQAAARAIESYDGAVVAGIDGPARGGGVELALACDIRVATPEATFAETGVSLGLFGAWGGTARLPRIIGEGDALELSLTGRTLDASEAQRIGLVSRVVDDPRTVAEELLDNDYAALRTLKQRIRDRDSLEQQETREIEAFQRLIASFELE